MTAFKNIGIGEMFRLNEGGRDFEYEKISETEAVLIENGVVTDFTLEYGVICL